MALTISATDSEVTHPLNSVFQQQFLRMAVPLCPYFTGTAGATLPKNSGTATVKWRRVTPPSPSVTALSEQTTTAAFMGGRDAAVTAQTDVLATAAVYGQFIILTDRVDLLAVPAQVMQISKSLGITAGRSLNMLQRDAAEDGLTKVYAGGVASTGAVVSRVTLSAIDAIINTLARNSARKFMSMSNGNQIVGSSPILPAYWGLCHPDVSYDIKNLAGFKSVDTYAGHTKFVPGEFGMVSGAGRGVRFIESEDATIDASAGGSSTSTGLRTSGSSLVDIYSTVIYGEDCIGSVGLGQSYSDGSYMPDDWSSLPDGIEMIVKNRESGGTSDPLNEIQTIGYKFWHAGKVLNTNWGRVLISGATDISAL